MAYSFYSDYRSYPCGPVFIVAKVGDRYRTFCSIQQFFLHVTLAERCLRLINIFEEPENRIPIQEELLLAQDKPEEFWAPEDQCPACCPFPFPYLATCIILGTSFDPAYGFLDHTKIFYPGQEFDKLQNSDAVTVMDISEPHNVKYCFVGYSPYSLPIPLMTPVSATSHLFDSYDRDGEGDDEEGGEEVGEGDEESEENSDYDEVRDEDSEVEEDEAVDAYMKDADDDGITQTDFHDSPVEHARTIAKGFEGRQLMTVQSLNSTWPRENWNGLNEASSNSTDQGLLSPSQVTSLRTLSLNMVIDTALKDPCFDMSWISELADLLKDCLPRLRDSLYNYSADLAPSTTSIRVIVRAFQDVPGFRLGAFQEFGMDDYLSVIAGLEQKAKLSVLNLSGSAKLDPEGLERILQYTTSLKTLYLMDNPSLSLRCVLDIIHENRLNVTNLYHPELFGMFLHHRARLPIPEEYRMKFSTGSSTKSPVVQILWVFVCASELDKYNCRSCGVHWDKFTADIRARGRHSDFSSYDSPGLNYGRFSLKHSLISPTKLVRGMSQFAEFSLNNKSWARHSYDSYAQAATSSFAMAPSSVEGSEFQVGPVPLMLSIDPLSPLKTIDDSAPDSLFSTLVPGDWSLLILHEHDYYKRFTMDTEILDFPKRWTYAFITTRSDSTSYIPNDDDIVIAYMDTFLAEVAGDEARKLSKFWEKVESEFVEIEPCDEEAVRALWRGLFYEKQYAERGSFYNRSVVVR